MFINKVTITVMFISCILYLESNCSENNIFINSINRERSYILGKINDTLLFNARSLKSNYSSIFQEQIIDTISICKKEELLQGIILIGEINSAINKLQLKDNLSFTTGFIEDEKLYTICIDAFLSEDIEVKKRAYEALLQYSRPDLLKKYSVILKEGIIKYRKASCYAEKGPRNKELCEQNKEFENIKDILPGDELYMMLPLTPAEKEIMLKKDINTYSRKTSRYASNEDSKKQNTRYKELYYRALLGDQKSEDSLIMEFEKVNNFNDKADMSNSLGIIGTPACAKALIRSLNSPLIAPVAGHHSIRLFLIKNLGRIHTEVPFLRMDCGYISRYGDGSYGGKEKIKGYISKVKFWAKKQYNVEPVGKEPEPILCIIRPEF